MSTSPHAATAWSRRQPAIAPLPSVVVERIAAGEVVQRPASVVRELIDNALDAAASMIRIEIREGGTRLIRVADDGVGIAASEMELACQAHTTSKLHSLDELSAVGTLGFRGEALASIVASADVELTSAAANEKIEPGGIARRIMLAGGKLVDEGCVARSHGTTVVVRDLFHALPARRAALRGIRGETARVVALTRAYALVYPHVRWVLVVDSGLVLSTAGTGLQATISAIYGSDVARGLLPLEAQAAEHGTLEGCVTTRALHFASHDHVIISVNGRLVANSGLAQAAEAGYRPTVRRGQHPLLIARLTVPPDEIDATVHPAKLEVLLRREDQWGALLRDAIRRALATDPVSLRHAAPAEAGTTHFTRPVPLDLAPRRQRRGFRLSASPPTPRRLGGHEPPTNPLRRIPRLEPLAQLDAALIIATTTEGDLYLIDQHRAHERILYERLRPAQQPTAAHEPTYAASETLVSRLPAPGQLLLEPLLVELTPAQADLLVARLEELRALGLDCQPFGGSTFLVRSLPAVSAGAVDARDVGDAHSPLARTLLTEAAASGDDWREAVRVALACRSAVRRGEVLSLEQQRALLADLRAVEAPSYCPHGSPLLVRYTGHALANTFEW